MSKAGDFSISGMGQSSGGKFADLDISGMGKINGDVEAERITISGKGTIEGNVILERKLDISGMGTIYGSVKGGQILSSGSGTIKGAVDVDLVESEGNLKIEGEARINELEVSGRCRIEASLKGEKIVSKGLLSVEGDVEAEEFYSNGTFSIAGLLNANKIEIEVNGYGRVREIGGEFIRVSKGRLTSPFAKLINPFLSDSREIGKLVVESIEGTAVSLEYTRANVVRGAEVVIGAGCAIKEVEYTDSIKVDPEAVVQKQTKV